jgi:hypothetical protein
MPDLRANWIQKLWDGGLRIRINLRRRKHTGMLPDDRITAPMAAVVARPAVGEYPELPVPSTRL